MQLFTYINSLIDPIYYLQLSEHFWSIPYYIYENIDKIIILYSVKEMYTIIKDTGLVSIIKNESNKNINDKNINQIKFQAKL